MKDNREKYSEKIEELINLIRSTYFNEFNIENTTATINFSYRKEDDFHITFPLKWNFDRKISDVISDCPLLNLHSHIGVKAANNIQTLYVYSNMDELYNSIDAFPNFIQSYNRSVRGIEKFSL